MKEQLVRVKEKGRGGGRRGDSEDIRGEEGEESWEVVEE